MKLTLTSTHTHGGKTYAAGTPLDVTVPDYLWLKSADLVDKVLQVGDQDTAQLTAAKADIPAVAPSETAGTASPAATAAKAPASSGTTAPAATATNG